jgi:hypothetical protein
MEGPNRVKTDRELIDLGMRGEKININRNVFKKTPEEKEALKVEKRKHKEIMKHE